MFYYYLRCVLLVKIYSEFLTFTYLLTSLAITTRLTDFGLPQHILPDASASCAPTPVGYTDR